MSENLLFYVRMYSDLDGDRETWTRLVLGLPHKVVNKIGFVDQTSPDTFLGSPTLGTAAIQVNSFTIALNQLSRGDKVLNFVCCELNHEGPVGRLTLPFAGQAFSPSGEFVVSCLLGRREGINVWAQRGYIVPNTRTKYSRAEQKRKERLRGRNIRCFVKKRMHIEYRLSPQRISVCVISYYVGACHRDHFFPQDKSINLAIN